MRAFESKPLAYQEDSTRILDRLSNCRNPVFLDSGGITHDAYRCDILSANPTYLIHSHNGKTTITAANGHQSIRTDNPFDIVQEYIPNIEGTVSNIFNGGMIGYFGYDLGKYIENITEPATDAEQIPDLMFGVYNWAVTVDHRNRESWLVGYPSDGFSDDDFQAVYQMLQPPSPQPLPSKCRILGDMLSNMDKQSYIERFHKVKQYIKNGDCYQVNLAQRFSIAVDCNPCDIYKRLRQLNPAPFSAYLDFDHFQILSTSPERFLQVQDGFVQTKPIKGTRPRRDNTDDDRNEKMALLSSKKDRAENLMIVDLLRNDLSKVCKTGTVSVHKLFGIESFANVHHLVSTVEGELADNKHVMDLLRACFPGGSITGAPKLRAMEIIAELEPDRRGVYCGAIGYIGGDRMMDLNIAIRTAIYQDGQFVFYGGGGIVADSEAEAEYQETLDKVASIMKLFY